MIFGEHPLNTIPIFNDWVSGAYIIFDLSFIKSEAKHYAKERISIMLGRGQAAHSRPLLRKEEV